MVLKAGLRSLMKATVDAIREEHERFYFVEHE